MIRFFLAVLVMFFLPFFVYAAYAFLKGEHKKADGLMANAPVNWLAIAGAVLAVGTLAKLVSTDILEYENQQNSSASTQETKPASRSP